MLAIQDISNNLLNSKVVSDSSVTWATSAIFSLPRPLCSRVRPHVAYATDRRQTKASLNSSTPLGWRHNKLFGLAVHCPSFRSVTPMLVRTGLEERGDVYMCILHIAK